MSRRDDKTKTEGNSVAVNAVSDVKKDDTTNVATGGETARANVLDKQNSSNSLVNTLQSRNLASNVREHLVAKATEFLVSLPVQYNSSMEKKFQFLRSKGLTDQEIQESFQRASAICNKNPNLHNNAISPQFYNNSSNEFGAIQTPFESEGWFKRLIQSIAFAATLAYIGYQLYKKYIENWLFGNKKSEMEKRFDTLEQTMQRCITVVEGKNINNPNDCIVQQHEIDQIKAELKSIKSLLLSRSQFPPAPASSSIPHWQLAKNTKPHLKQPKIVSSDEIPSSMQQKIPNGVKTPIPIQPKKSKIITNDIETLIPVQPIKTEIKTNGMEIPISTQSIEVGGAEIPNSPQQNKLYDLTNTSSEIMSPDKNANADENCVVNSQV